MVGTESPAVDVWQSQFVIGYDISVRADGDAVVGGLRRALVDGGLSQAEMARALGTSASRFSTYMTGKTVPSAALFVRAQQLGEACAAAGERGWLTPMGAVRAIRDAVGSGDRMWGLRLILQCRDHGRAALADPGHSAVAAWTVDPGSTGADDLDALLAAVIGHEFGAAGRVAPDWAASTGPDGPWLFPSPFFTTEEIEDATPPWLRDRGVLIAARDLVTV
ncbi:MAG TPA: helix-turn-helix transcriptional regulator [Microlunatus sp.]